MRGWSSIGWTTGISRDAGASPAPSSASRTTHSARTRTTRRPCSRSSVPSAATSTACRCCCATAIRSAANSRRSNRSSLAASRVSPATRMARSWPTASPLVAWCMATRSVRPAHSPAGCTSADRSKRRTAVTTIGLTVEPVVRVPRRRRTPQRFGCRVELRARVVLAFQGGDAAPGRGPVVHGRSRASRSPMRALRSVGGAKSCFAARM